MYIELCILLAYTGCTEGNTKGLSDNMICYQSWLLSEQDLTFKWRYTHVSGHHAIDGIQRGLINGTLQFFCVSVQYSEFTRFKRNAPCAYFKGTFRHLTEDNHSFFISISKQN